MGKSPTKKWTDKRASFDVSHIVLYLTRSLIQKADDMFHKDGK